MPKFDTSCGCILPKNAILHALINSSLGKLSSNDESDIIFYLNATIKTNNHLIDIIDDIRISLNSDDVNEIISYEKGFIFSLIHSFIDFV